MSRKVTIQDIADALGISRNTVSKAINNTEGLADSTREKILEKAIEMGYKQFSYVATLNAGAAASSAGSLSENRYSGEVSLLTTTYVSGSHFASLFLDRFHHEITAIGFTPVTHLITADNLSNLTLPVTFNPEKTNAVICLELFDRAYSDMITSLGVPVLFIDGPANTEGAPLNSDILLMDNCTEITRFVNEMVRRGLTKIGFIGDYMHCRSFYERYSSYRLAMINNRVAVDEKFLICPKDGEASELKSLLYALDEMPDVFICANDFVAIDAMQVMSEKDPNIRSKVRFFGFDDSYESRIVYPALSTVHIHTQVMAFSALHLLVSRINEPSMDYRIVYCATDLVLRASTEF